MSKLTRPHNTPNHYYSRLTGLNPDELRLALAQLLAMCGSSNDLTNNQILFRAAQTNALGPGMPGPISKGVSFGQDSATLQEQNKAHPTNLPRPTPN